MHELDGFTEKQIAKAPPIRLKVFDENYRLEIGDNLKILWDDPDFRTVIQLFNTALRCEHTFTVFDLPRGDLVEIAPGPITISGDDQEMISGAAAEMQKVQDERIIVGIDFYTAFCLISGLQLALSHPAASNYEQWTTKARDFIEHLTKQFREMPNCQKLIDLGWTRHK